MPGWYESIFETDEWLSDDGTLMLEEPSYGPTTGRASSRWTFVRADGTRSTLEFDLRLYSAVELGELLRAAGLEPVAHFGGADGSELTRDSRRLIVVAERTG